MGKFAKFYFGVMFAALIGTIVVHRCVAREAKHWIVEGYAATSRINLNDYCIAEEALEGAVNDLRDFQTVFLDHDQGRPIGRILQARFRNKKLWVQIEISQTEKLLWEKIKDGTLSRFSVQIRAFSKEFDYSDKLDRDFVRITKLVMIEVSIVSIPADRHAKILEWREE